MTTPNRVAIPGTTPTNMRVDFRPDEFDKVIMQKGYDVLWKRMLICPCRKPMNDAPNSNCVNCDGSGYFYIAGEETKAIITNAMMQKNFSQQWSEVLQGTVNATVMSNIKMGWMDSFAVLNAESMYTQVRSVKVRAGDPRKYIDLTYTPIEIVNCYRFLSEDSALQEIDVDDLLITEINGRPSIVINTVGVNLNDDITLLYKHNPVYLVIDIMNDYRNTKTKISDTKETNHRMPLRALLKRKHLVTL